MRDVLEPILDWYDSGETFGLATVVNTFRSAPRAARGGDGGLTGPTRLSAVSPAGASRAPSTRPRNERSRPASQYCESYGFSDDDAFAVGLTCGGILDIFVEPVDQRHVSRAARDRRLRRAREPVAVATVIGGAAACGARRVIWGVTAARGSPGHRPAWTHAVDDDARGMLAQGVTGQRHYGVDGERRWTRSRSSCRPFAPPPRMVVFGAIDFAAAVARVGKFLGYHVTVCDARPVFATGHALPRRRRGGRRVAAPVSEALDVTTRTVICVLTHDPKFDVPLLRGRAADPGRVHRRDGQPAYARGPD